MAQRFRNGTGQRIRFTNGQNVGKRMKDETCCCGGSCLDIVVSMLTAVTQVDLTLSGFDVMCNPSPDGIYILDPGTWSGGSFCSARLDRFFSYSQGTVGVCRKNPSGPTESIFQIRFEFGCIGNNLLLSGTLYFGGCITEWRMFRRAPLTLSEALGPGVLTSTFNASTMSFSLIT